MEIANDKYGIPTTLRLPASIKLELQNKAVQRGLTLAEFLGTIILSHHTNTEKQDQEYNRVYKELQALTSVYKELQMETKWVDNTTKPVIEILLNNEKILKKLYKNFGSEPIEKKVLIEEKFDFSYATHKADKEGRIYVGLFSAYYTEIKRNRIIIILNNDTYGIA